MAGFSFVFFCVAPFALFCSEDGNGMILCAIYLILGLLCKRIENGGLKPKVYIEPKDWWECNYRQNMAQGRGHKASKSIADFTTKSNHFPMPSEEIKECIAKSYGVATEKMKKDAQDRWDRIQVAKYILMGKLIEKYKNEYNDIVNFENPVKYIEASRNFLSFAVFGTAGKYNTFHRFKQDDEEVWGSLPEEEKNEAKQWVDEYEERFLREVTEYIKYDREMPTITKHYDSNGNNLLTLDHDKEYGFRM